jgi:heme-degrading monooxygenase HmoA
VRVAALFPATRMKEFAMSEIQENNRVVTQITTVKLPPSRQDDVLNLMTERARFMAGQPGFISIALHRSKDGSHVVNYVRWSDADKLKAAHHSPEFRKKWPQFGKITEEIEPCLYDVVHVESA